MNNNPNKNRMTYVSHTLPSLHNKICVEVCVLFEHVHVCILYTGGMCCGCWKQVSSRWQSSESLCWMMCVVELLGGHVA